MARRGYTTTIGKIAKVHHDRRVSEIRTFAELLQWERAASASSSDPAPRDGMPTPAGW